MKKYEVITFLYCYKYSIMYRLTTSTTQVSVQRKYDKEEGQESPLELY